MHLPNVDVPRLGSRTRLFRVTKLTDVKVFDGETAVVCKDNIGDSRSCLLSFVDTVVKKGADTWLIALCVFVAGLFGVGFGDI